MKIICWVLRISNCPFLGGDGDDGGDYAADGGGGDGGGGEGGTEEKEERRSILIHPNSRSPAPAARISMLV